jgi:sugar lactone lactonase YvrE
MVTDKGKRMIPLHNISEYGTDLHRPECILCTKKGNVYTSDWRGGVTRIDAQGNQTTFLSNGTDLDVKPNGIALMPDGSFLLAHLGAETGGVFQLYRSGDLTSFVTEVDGETLPPSNFVHIDHQQRVWITVSTRVRPRSKAYTPTISDGFIVLKDSSGTRIVADDLGYTNECLVSPCGEYLYVNETSPVDYRDSNLLFKEI